MTTTTQTEPRPALTLSELHQLMDLAGEAVLAARRHGRATATPDADWRAADEADGRAFDALLKAIGDLTKYTR